MRGQQWIHEASMSLVRGRNKKVDNELNYNNLMHTNQRIVQP